jgi:CDP-diglyceride synthetase
MWWNAWINFMEDTLSIKYIFSFISNTLPFLKMHKISSIFSFGMFKKWFYVVNFFQISGSNSISCFMNLAKNTTHIMMFLTQLNMDLRIVSGYSYFTPFFWTNRACYPLIIRPIKDCSSKVNIAWRMETYIWWSLKFVKSCLAMCPPLSPCSI